MQTFNSFNELVAANSQTPLVSDMSVFNELPTDWQKQLDKSVDATDTALEILYELERHSDTSALRKQAGDTRTLLVRYGASIAKLVKNQDAHSTSSTNQ